MLSIAPRRMVLLRALLELCLATYGSMAIASALIYVNYPLVHFVNRSLDFRSFSRILSDPHFPFQLAAGLCTGYSMWRRLGGPLTLWLWVIPLALLLYRFSVFETSVLEPPLGARVRYFFGAGCRPPSCFDQLRYTAPFYSSLAYSFGALLNKAGVFRFNEATHNQD